MSFKNSWKQITMGQISEMQYGKMPKKELIVENGYPIFSGYKITGFYKEVMFKEPQLIVVARGVGGTGDVKISPPNCFLTNLSIAIMLDEKAVLKEFLYYYFKVSKLRILDTGSAQSQITIADLKRLRIYLPKLDEQKEIVRTLSLIDKKIEANNRINKTLEEMAQAVFNSWFIDFEPFKDGEFVDSELGSIPKGWRIDSLTSLAEFLNGLAMQKYRPNSEKWLPVIKIRELNQGFADESCDKASVDIPRKYIIDDGDIIFSWSGTLVLKLWVGGKGGLNQHLFRVTPYDFPKWFVYFWIQYHMPFFKLISSSKATTMGHINRNHLEESKVIIPSKELITKADLVIGPIFKQIINLSIENRKLIDLRDSLLPKLMSGEIRVPIEEGSNA